MKLITVFLGESIITSKINDVKELKLPQLWERKIQQIIDENKMLYEPYIESAKDFNELKERLKGRGYSDLPMGVNLLLHIDAYGKAPKAETSSCKIRRTMIKKNNNS